MPAEWDEWEKRSGSQSGPGRSSVWDHRSKPVVVSRSRDGVTVEGDAAGDAEVVRQVRERFGDSVPTVEPVAAVASETDGVWEWDAADPAEIAPDNGRGGGSINATSAPGAYAKLGFDRDGVPDEEVHWPGAILLDAATEAGLLDGDYEQRHRFGVVTDDVPGSDLWSPFGDAAAGTDKSIYTTVFEVAAGAGPGIDEDGDVFVAGDPQADVVDPDHELTQEVDLDPLDTIAARPWPPSLAGVDIPGTTVNNVDESVLFEADVAQQFAGILRGTLHPSPNVRANPAPGAHGESDRDANGNDPETL